MLQGKADEAVACYQRAIEIDPNFAEARFNMGLLLDRNGRTAEAIAQWQEAIRLRPDNPAMLDKLAWTLATSPEVRSAMGSGRWNSRSGPPALRRGKSRQSWPHWPRPRQKLASMRRLSRRLSGRWTKCAPPTSRSASSFERRSSDSPPVSRTAKRQTGSSWVGQRLAARFALAPNMSIFVKFRHRLGWRQAISAPSSRRACRPRCSAGAISYVAVATLHFTPRRWGHELREIASPEAAWVCV